MACHPFAPTSINQDSRILILGSFPSIKSREIGFYYANKHNRFWKMLCSIFNEELPLLDSINISQYQNFLIKHRLVLWDIAAECEIEKSNDSSLKIKEFNNIYGIIKNTNIHTVCLNGATAAKLFKKYQSQQTTIIKELKIYALPSTSPRNARYNLAKLIESYAPLLK